MKDTLRSSFGHFAAGGEEFVVEDLETPRALVNYFWNESFISGISQHGGGEGVYKERAMQYVDLRGRAVLVKDGHRYFYLREESDGSVWSPGWHPAQAELDKFQCTHGLGYSVIESERKGIYSKLRVFVPESDPCEIWTVTIGNRRDIPAVIKFYSVADWALEGYPRYCDYFGMLHGEYYADIFAAQACNRAVERCHDVYDGFIASDLEPSGFETSRKEFLGNWGDFRLPAAVATGRLNGTLASCEYMASALEHTLELAPGKELSFNLLIGASSGYEMTKEIAGKLFALGEIDRELAALRERKREMVDRVRIKTPDLRVNYLINGWIKQQTQVYADVGSDNGRGFRDAMQLIWASASYEPDYTRKMLLECLQHQFADGHTLRGWLPIDDHHYSDGPVWIAPVVDAYLKETGEFDILDELVPYYGGGEGTIWDHVCRGLIHSSDDLGEHGMIRCHFGDWNDSLTGVGIEGRGESVWTTIGIIYGLKLAARIACEIRKDQALADDFTARAERLTKAVDEYAWDGEWYLRAINDYGEKIGTHTEQEGRIWLLPQVWAILADMVDDKRKAQLFEMIDTHLECDTGSRVQFPAFTKPNPRIGRITNLVPGMWENGTAYCHANGFKIIADCVGGRGDKAYMSFRKAMPDSEWNPSTKSGCEPYVLTNQYLGPENPRAGQTLWAWMTGAGGWYYRAMTEWMLGVRADFHALVIDPCLPSDWEHASLERDFRGARYRVEIHNPHGLQKGRSEISIDGESLEGNMIPIYDDGKLHEVNVTLQPMSETPAEVFAG